MRLKGCPGCTGKTLPLEAFHARQMVIKNCTSSEKFSTPNSCAGDMDKHRRGLTAGENSAELRTGGMLRCCHENPPSLRILIHGGAVAQTLLQRDVPVAAAAGSMSPGLRQPVCTHHLCEGRAATAKAELCDTELSPKDLKLCWVKSSFFAFSYICHL